MRLFVTGGGTGGHVYPALAIIEALLGHAEWTTVREDVVWVGATRGIEAQVAAREGIRFQGITTGAIRGANPWQMVQSVMRILKGTAQSWRLLKHEPADVILATGGYVSVPLVLAAWLRRRPLLIELPDMEPGLAVKFLARFASRIAVSFESVQDYFAPRKVMVSGYPVRSALYTRDRQAARAALLLQHELPLVLIFGGSAGSHAINQGVWQGLEQLLEHTQVIHVCGSLDYDTYMARRDKLEPTYRERYRPYAYLHEEMVDALVAANLVVARAGAATLGEFPAVGVPAILVPYPYAGQHQQVNADYAAQRGAALVLQDHELDHLAQVVIELIQDEQRLLAMGEAAKSMARPQAAHDIAAELVALAKGAANG